MGHWGSINMVTISPDDVDRVVEVRFRKGPILKLFNRYFIMILCLNEQVQTQKNTLL